MFYAYRMTQIHQLCTRKDQEKKFRVCFIFKAAAQAAGYQAQAVAAQGSYGQQPGAVLRKILNEYLFNL